VSTSLRRIVVTDANVLINLMHVSRLGLLGKIPNHEFVVPEHVRDEIAIPEQRAVLDAAILCAAHEARTLDELGAVAGWTGEAQRRTFVRAARELLVETLRPGGSDGAWITKHTKDEDKPSGATSMPMHLLAPAVPT
jgi:hypothetical protein